MKKDSILDFIIRNRYVIICVALVLILALTGIIGKLMELIFTILLILLAIYIGKRIQEDENYISHIFKKKEAEIKYTVKDEDEK